MRGLLGMAGGWGGIVGGDDADIISFCLSILCGLVALVAGGQLVRIQVRVPEYGWTTQKVFHLLNFLCFLAYGAVLGMWEVVKRWRVSGHHGLQFAALVMEELPGLLFFTTYTLLVLFWAEIYHQARSHPLTWLKPAFVLVNLVIYAVQLTIWLLMAIFDKTEKEKEITGFVSTVFQSCVQFGAALSFIMYGTLLFTMLYRFPIESKGRQKKLQEVGSVAVVCSLTFVARVVAAIVYYVVYGLDPFKQPYETQGFVLLCSVVPAIFVLIMLRKLPPKKSSQGYQPIG